MIAALYVQKNGIYYGLDNVDPWDKDRDARLYNGPYSVIAYPPCERWGRYWSGGPSAKERRKLGDDNGCFEAALKAVRNHGGVLEHPEGSHAFKKFHIPCPDRHIGWIPCLDGGFVCYVEQGHYGHPARKGTWLYVYGTTNLPKLNFSKSEANRKFEDSYHSAEERKMASKLGVISRLKKWERAATPIQFRDILISIAESCSPNP